jgi:hypothetical protein
VTSQISQPAGVSLATKGDSRGGGTLFLAAGACLLPLSKDYGIIQVLVTSQEIGSA